MIPFTDEFKIRTELENGDSEFTDFVTERKDIFVFGSVKLAHIGARKGWNPGSMFNENHDFEVYSKHYKGHLLNEDVIYQKSLNVSLHCVRENDKNYNPLFLI
jgi:hypothetical protein